MIVKANEQKLHQWRHLVSPPRQGKSLAVGLSVRALAAWRTLPSSWQIRSCRLSRGLRDCVETKHKVCLNFVTVELLCLNREEPSMPLVLHPQRLENSWPLPRAEPVEQTRLHGFDEPRHSIYGAGSLASLQLVANCLHKKTGQPGGRSGGLAGLRTGRCARRISCGRAQNSASLAFPLGSTGKA